MITALKTHQNLPVYSCRFLTATEGVAEGDPISFADEMIMDDIYRLRHNAKQDILRIEPAGKTRFHIVPGSAVGVPGRDVVLDSCLTFMVPDGTTVEILILVELLDGGVEEVYALPLAPLHLDLDYRLVGVDRHAATTRLAEVACISYTRGTNITMASGLQVPIEDLKVGDMILTRDDGPQPIRWIGQTTLRALGEFAPVVVKKGAIHNERDLLLSPEQRIFVYQRQDRLGAGRSEVLVKVRHLINGDTVYQRDGGFVDYFQLLFDRHQIIYAEGIAAESLLINSLTRPALPTTFEGPELHDHRTHMDYEVRQTLLPQSNAIDLLRKASSS